MDVRFVSAGGVELWDVSQLPTLLARTDGLVWVDVPVWDEQAEQTLSTTFGFHPLAVRDSAYRNQVPNSSLHRPSVPGAARAAARRRRPRALRRTRPVHRRALSRHRARPTQPGRRPGGGDAGWRRQDHSQAIGPTQWIHQPSHEGGLDDEDVKPSRGPRWACAG